MKRCTDGECGGASIFALTFALLLIATSALGAIAYGQFGARRAEVRKIEALGLAAMERAGGEAGLACAIVRTDSRITCEFGGGEIDLWGSQPMVIRVGWRASGAGE